MAQRLAPEAMKSVLEASPDWKAADATLAEKDFEGVCTAHDKKEQDVCSENQGKIECEARLTDDASKRLCYWVKLTQQQVKFEREPGQCMENNPKKTCRHLLNRRACLDTKGCSFMSGSCGEAQSGKCRGNTVFDKNPCAKIVDACACFKETTKGGTKMCIWSKEDRGLEGEGVGSMSEAETAAQETSLLEKKARQVDAVHEHSNTPVYRPTVLFMATNTQGQPAPPPRWNLGRSAGRFPFEPNA